MAEYIERTALRDALYAADAITMQGVKILNQFPAAEVEPVRHGVWTKSEDDWYSLTTITCSECHEEWCFETEADVNLLRYRYCPNCGARMEG